MWSKRLSSFFGFCFAVLVGLGIPAQAAPGAPVGASEAGLPKVSITRQALRFEANQGQLDGETRFVSRGPGFSLSLQPSGASLLVQELEARQRSPSAPLAEPRPASRLFLGLVDANPSPRITGEGELPGRANYLIGQDASRWRSGVPTFDSVRYDQVYPGIALLFHGRRGSLEYDFEVAPFADPSVIGLRFDGADRVAVEEDGSLLVEVANQSFHQPKPTVYQETEQGRFEVVGSYKILDDRVRFEVASYDRSRPLVIDPVLAFSLYTGGNEFDELLGSAHDGVGNMYISGVTASADLPLVSPLDGSYGGAGDAYVAKYARDGSLIYCTYLGGKGFEQSWGLLVDDAGFAYVIGDTKSPDFPVLGAVQSKFGGIRDAFVTKLDPSGSRMIFSTYLGGRATDFGYSVHLDRHGDLLVSGTTDSADFPTRFPVQREYGGGGDGFVARLTKDGSALTFSTFLGGSKFDRAWGVESDKEGRIFISGLAQSPDFPTTANAFQRRYGGGLGDGFVTGLTPDGRSFLFSTFIGGTGPDNSTAISVDRVGNIFITGLAGNSSFPTRRALQPIFGGGDSDAYVAGFSPTGVLRFSTYFGGSGMDGGFALDHDDQGSLYVTGITGSSNFPVRSAVQTTYAGGNDGFLAKFSRDARKLVYATYFGGKALDTGAGISVDSRGSVYVVGFTEGTDFPALGPGQKTYGGLRDGVVLRFGDNAAPATSCSTAVRQLRHPDGGMIDVGLTTLVEDDSDPEPLVEVQVFGDRGSATEHARLDASGTLSLRAERGVSGEARVYLVAITATDAAGNKGVGTCSVVVPGNNGTENPERAQERAAAAEASYRQRTAPPAGFSQLDATTLPPAH